MQPTPPDWTFMGREDGRFGRARQTIFPSDKERDLYDAGYAKGKEETRKGPPRPSSLPRHTPVA